jgi:hypothetical protein
MRINLIVISIVICGIMPSIANGQTVEECLSQGSDIYQEMADYFVAMNKANKTENVSFLSEKKPAGLRLLKQVVEQGSESQRLAANYYSQRIIFIYGAALYRMEIYKDAIKEFKTIEPLINAYQQSTFPIYFSDRGQKYQIEWDMLLVLRANVQYYLGWCSYILESDEEAVKYFQKYISEEKTEKKMLYFCYDNLVQIKKDTPKVFSLELEAQYAAGAIRQYVIMDAVNRAEIDEDEFTKVEDPIQRLISKGLLPDKNNTVLSFCAQAAQDLGTLRPSDSKVLELYEIAMRGYEKPPAGSIYAFNSGIAAYDFLKNAQQYAQGMRTKDKFRSDYVGINAVGHLAAICPENDCTRISEVADLYDIWNKPVEAKIYRAKIKPCIEEAEKIAKKAERESARQNRSHSGNFNLYAGSYILPLIFEKKGMKDVGGVLNFSFPKVAFEFSYLQILRKKENTFDLWIRDVNSASQDNISRWDGYYAGFQTKFFDDDGARYVGLLFGYARKNFDPMNVSVINDISLVQSEVAFDPAVTQYIAMINLGAMKLHKGIGIDVYYGFGANYSQFNAGTTINRSEYTIANPLLENRKDSYFGFIMRIGMTFGFNLGRGN